MTEMETTARSRAYVTPAGTAPKRLVAGQMIHMLASQAETAGAYGVVVCESARDKGPIPLHYHDREHDTWYCLRGRVQVWADDASRVLAPGDFAYVPPGVVHAYQCTGAVNRFLGFVAPGGWEGFFDMAGDTWELDGLPEHDHPYDFAKMGPAMGRYGVNRVERDYAVALPDDGSEVALPEAPAAYVLRDGGGVHVRIGRHIATAILTREVSDGSMDVYAVEGGRGGTMPALVHGETHVTLYLTEGRLDLTLDGATTQMGPGDFANIPSGTAYATRVASGSAKWILCGGNGDGLSYLSAGTPTEAAHFAADGAVAADPDLAGGDARLA